MMLSFLSHIAIDFGINTENTQKKATKKESAEEYMEKMLNYRDIGEKNGCKFAT